MEQLLILFFSKIALVSRAEKSFDIWGILEMASVKSGA